MNSIGTKRIFRYMVSYTERLFLLFIALLAGWSVYMGVVTGSIIHFSITDLINSIPSYFVMIGNLLIFIFVAYLPVLMPMVVSMGATRKEYFSGVMAAIILIILQLVIVNGLIEVLIRGTGFQETIRLMLFAAGSFMLTSGIGLVTALLVQRFGRIAYYAVVVVIAITFGICGGMSVAILRNPDIAVYTAKMSLVTMIAGIVVFIAGSILHRVFTRKLSVSV